MADDSYYWQKDEDELTDAEREARAEDLSWARYRAHVERRNAEQRATQRDELPRPSYAPLTRAPQPNRGGKFARWMLATLIFLGGPSVTALILHNTLEGDNDPTKMDFVQALEGVGIYGSMATVLVILVMAAIIFD